MHAPYEHAHHVHHHPSALGIGLGIAGVLLTFAVLRRVLRRRFGPMRHRRALRWLFRRLDTSVSQETAIRAALEPLRAQLASMRTTGRDTRGAVASVLRGDAFDLAAFQAAFDGPAASARDARDAAAAALAQIHAVLSPDQRATLAALLERGPRPFGHRGPFGGHRHA